jgi:hypothetical protein
MDSYKDQTSPELTELRTVLSRSKTAFDSIQHLPKTWGYQQHHTSDERIKMLGDLAIVIQKLEAYEGKRKSWGQRHPRG